MARLQFFAVFLASFLTLGLGSSVFFIDSSTSSYLKVAQPTSLDYKSLSSVISALLGLVPPHEGSSLQVDDFVKPTIFHYPRAALIVSGVGSTKEAAILSAFSARTVNKVKLVDLQTTAAGQSVHSALALVVAANRELEVEFFDQSSLKNCLDGCVLDRLDEVCSVVSCQLSSNGKRLRDTKLLVEGVTIDLEHKTGLLLSLELVSFYSSVIEQLQRVNRRSANSGVQQDVEVFEVTFMSLQAMSAAFGATSKEVAAAEAALVALLQWAVQQLDIAYGGEVVYQVALLESVGPASQEMHELEALRTAMRRQLQSDNSSSIPPDDTASMQQFTVKAAGYGAFIILLYFTIAAVYCMCTMKFKQDSLLYSRTKTD